MLAPKLRFKEFDGEWEKRELKDFTKINQGLQIAISERYSEQVDGSLFYITNEFLKKDSKKSYFIKNPPLSVICNEDDLLMTRTGNTGQVVTGVHGAFHNNFFKIKFDSSCEKWFLFYFLTSYRTQHTILKLAGTSTIPDLNHIDFYKITIIVPDFPEQQKIASFLSSVDEKIQQLTRKKELLEQYKKGVMQQLFSGKLRFKDDNGKEFPELEEKRLGEYLIYKSERNFNNEVQLVLSVSNKKGFISQDEQFDGYTVASKDLSNYKIVYKNEIAYNPSRINVGSIARLYNFEKGIVSPMYIVFGLKNELDSVFFENHYTTHRFKHLIRVGCSGSVRDSLNFEDLANFRFSFPSLQEQQKIANYISGIDAKIESVTKQITQTQTFKKGLLQQMFV